MSRGPRRSRPRRRAALVSSLLLLGPGCPLWAQTPAPSSSANSPAGAAEGNLARVLASEVGRVFATCKQAVVRIQAVDHYGSHVVATGFFVDPKGTIYTNYSISRESGNFTVEFADKKYPASCVLRDPRSGVAMLKIEADTPFLPVGRSEALEPTDPVVVIGYFRDLPASFSYGPVVGFNQRALGAYLPVAHICADVLVQPGQQGAPLLNLRGEVVGIVAYRLGDTGACYALPIRAAEKVRRDFVRFGEPRPGFLGVDISPSPDFVNDEPTETRVADLTPNSPAANGGLQTGDVLLRVGNQPIRRPLDMMDVAFYLTGGDEVPVMVQRGAEQLTLHIQAADEPGSARAAAARRVKPTLGPRGDAGQPGAEQSARLSLEKER